MSEHVKELILSDSCQVLLPPLQPPRIPVCKENWIAHTLFFNRPLSSICPVLCTHRQSHLVYLFLHCLLSHIISLSMSLLAHGGFRSPLLLDSPPSFHPVPSSPPPPFCSPSPSFSSAPSPTPLNLLPEPKIKHTHTHTQASTLTRTDTSYTVHTLTDSSPNPLQPVAQHLILMLGEWGGGLGWMVG